MHYDLVVLGSGPSGQKGAIAAAKLGKRVAIVERKSAQIGGVCSHTGTIPSKTMREAILHLSGYRHRDVYGEQYRRKRHITIQDLQRKVLSVSQHERDVIEDQLDRNGVDIFSGNAKFLGPNAIEVSGDGIQTVLKADRILLAVGTVPDRPTNTQFDGKRIFDSDQLLSIDRIPRSMLVVGGGVIGIEYAIMFATLGVHVTVIDGRERLLSFCDGEIVDSLLYHCRSIGMVFRLGASPSNWKAASGSSRKPHSWRLAAEAIQTGSTWKLPDWKPTNAAACHAMRSTRPTSRTSTRLVTSLAFPLLPAQRWSRAARRSPMRSNSRPVTLT
jgi:NAD(P) transhydrogenase